MPGMLNNYKVISQEYGTTFVETMPCMICKQTTSIPIPDELFWRWFNGEFVQDVFPDWSVGKRELLISGTHPNCWEKLFESEEA